MVDCATEFACEHGGHEIVIGMADTVLEVVERPRRLPRPAETDVSYYDYNQMHR